ncbi:MAG TPA: 5'-nucleosidase [Steroidobacteraceae bacterium]|nr:5'-nucleosidase [Steroidobacteraceae bacterium]
MSDLPSTLVVMALPVESSGVLEAGAVPVLYCGVGKVNAAIALTRELARYAQQQVEMPLVVNFGSVGSRCHPSGTLVSCHAFVQRDMDVSGLGFPLGVTPYDEAPSMLIFDPVFSNLPAALCGSGDSFAMADIAVDCEVLDMEAYALAKACWHEEARFACAKYVTDGADHAAAGDWRNNVHKAAEDFLQLFRDLTGSTE